MTKPHCFCSGVAMHEYKPRQGESCESVSALPASSAFLPLLRSHSLSPAAQAPILWVTHHFTATHRRGSIPQHGLHLSLPSHRQEDSGAAATTDTTPGPSGRQYMAIADPVISLPFVPLSSRYPSIRHSAPRLLPRGAGGGIPRAGAVL